MQLFRAQMTLQQAAFVTEMVAREPAQAKAPFFQKQNEKARYHAYYCGDLDLMMAVV